MQVPESTLAFAVESHDPPAIEIRVNFGVFAGRDATAAEIDDLAKALLPEVGQVSVVSEERHELTEDVEIALHQVRIEVDAESMPADEVTRRALSGRLVGTAERWAQSCIADRHADLAEL